MADSPPYMRDWTERRSRRKVRPSYYGDDHGLNSNDAIYDRRRTLRRV